MARLTRAQQRAIHAKKRKHTDSHLIRDSINSENAAIVDYEHKANEAHDPLVRRAFSDIAHEERVHVGEFRELLRRRDPLQLGATRKGRREIIEMDGEY